MKKYSQLAFLVLLLFCISTLSNAQNSPIKIACVGNSITAGYGLKNPNQEAYPALLQNKIGTTYFVENFGVSARTMLKHGDLPYWNEPQYKAALALNPNIVIIKLGTNDSKRHIWDVYGSEFVKDYSEMISMFKALPSHPEIYICLAIPGENRNWGIYNSYIKDSLNPQIKNIAKANAVNLIDLYTVFKGNENNWLMADSVHPNNAGCEALSQVVAQVLLTPKPIVTYSQEYLSTIPAASFQWYRDNQPIPDIEGGNLQSIKPTKSGRYTVYVQLQKTSSTYLTSQEFLFQK